jgi:hypothetical protein
LGLRNTIALGWLGTGQKYQPKLADLNFITVGQRSRVDRFTVDVGAVEAADVDDVELAAVGTELGMAATDGHIVEKDLRVGMPAR